MNSRECVDVDFGLFEVVSRVETPEEEFKIDQKLANKTAEAAQRNVKAFQKHLIRSEVISGCSQKQRMVAVSVSVTTSKQYIVDSIVFITISTVSTARCVL